MSSGDVGDRAGQQGPQDQPGWPGEPPQSGNQSPFAAQPPFGPQPGGYGQPGPYSQPGPYGQTGGGYAPPGSPYPQFGPSDAYGQPGWQQSRPTNSLAIAALCCGIAQILVGPLTGIPAIILGSMSLGQIHRSGEQGRGMAITGLVLGIVGTILTILFVLLFVVAWRSLQNGPPARFGSP